MRKEYNDRWNAPLVNPPITHGEWESQRAAREQAKDAELISGFESMLAARDAEQAKHFEQVRARSERA